MGQGTSAVMCNYSCTELPLSPVGVLHVYTYKPEIVFKFNFSSRVSSTCGFLEFHIKGQVFLLLETDTHLQEFPG